MINEQKVKLMTHMAVYEDMEQNTYNIAANFSRKDFVSLHKVVAFVAQTILYFFLYTLLMVLLAATVFSQVKVNLVVVAAIIGIAGYAMHSYFYMRWISARIEAKYDEAQEKLAVITSDYEKLDELINPKQAEED